MRAAIRKPANLIFLLWGAFVCLAPVLTHQYFSASGVPPWHKLVLENYMYLAPLCVCLLLFQKVEPRAILWRLINRKALKIVVYPLLAAIAIQFVVAMATGMQLSTRGRSTITVGLVLITCVVLSSRLSYLGEAESVLVSVILSMVIIAALELPYQYLFREHNYFELRTITMQFGSILLSALVVMLYYRLVPSTGSIVLLVSLATCYVLWLTVFGKWSVLVIDYSTTPPQQSLKESINWPVYQMVKSMRVQLAMALILLRPHSPVTVPIVERVGND